MLTRIYVHMEKWKDLNAYLHAIDEAEKEIIEKLVKKWTCFIFKKKHLVWFFGTLMVGQFIEYYKILLEKNLSNMTIKRLILLK